MNINDTSKYEECLAELSIELLKTPIGGKVITISEFCDSHNFARGTVQTAYMRIRNTEAITVNPRGRLGTFVEEKDYHKLFTFAKIPLITVGVPLPYFPELIGINVGLKENIEDKLSIPVHFVHQQHATDRLDDLLDNKVDCAVLPKYLALQAILHGDDLQIIGEFGKQIFDVDSSIKPSIETELALANIVHLLELVQGKAIDLDSLNIEKISDVRSAILDFVVNLQAKSIKERYNIDNVDPYHPQLAELVLVVNNSQEYIVQVLKEIINTDEVAKMIDKAKTGQLSRISY